MRIRPLYRERWADQLPRLGHITMVMEGGSRGRGGRWSNRPTLNDTTHTWPDQAARGIDEPTAPLNVVKAWDTILRARPPYVSW